MAIELQRSINVTNATNAVHSNGESFSTSLLRSNNAALDTSSSVIRGSASLIFTAFVGQNSAEKNIQEQVVAEISPKKVSKPSDFGETLKEVRKLQSQLTTSKSTLTTLDSESSDAELLEQVCAFLQIKIGLYNLLGANSTALIAG